MSQNRSESDLCTACGLCCSGAIFDYGSLDSHEVGSARSNGMAVIEAGDEAGFTLPCPQLEGAVCQIYVQRPHTCRAYRCMTLKALEAGEIDREAALQRIDTARRALAEVQRHLPQAATITDARRWRREAVKAEAAQQLVISPLLMMALGLLDIEIDLNFRKPGKRQIMPDDE